MFPGLSTFKTFPRVCATFGKHVNPVPGNAKNDVLATILILTLAEHLNKYSSIVDLFIFPNFRSTILNIDQYSPS